LPGRVIAYIRNAMKKRLLLLSVSLLSLSFASDAVAGDITIARVPMPELTSSEWAMLHQQQGANPQIVPVALNLAVDHGVVYGVSIRHGSGYPDIDRTIVNWVTNNWRTDIWFKGGDSYVVCLDIDPELHHVVFRGNDGNVARRTPLIEPLRADVALIKVN
jgi:hypothetical protein